MQKNDDCFTSSCMLTTSIREKSACVNLKHRFVTMKWYFDSQTLHDNTHLLAVIIKVCDIDLKLEAGTSPVKRGLNVINNLS